MTQLMTVGSLFFCCTRRCEEEFGYPIVNRQAGGNSGGKSSVTEKGHELLAAYDELLAELVTIAEERFEGLKIKYRLTEESSADPEE